VDNYFKLDKADSLLIIFLSIPARNFHASYAIISVLNTTGYEIKGASL